jgi:hypothetical protein
MTTFSASLTPYGPPTSITWWQPQCIRRCPLRPTHLLLLQQHRSPSIPEVTWWPPTSILANECVIQARNLSRSKWWKTTARILCACDMNPGSLTIDMPESGNFVESLESYSKHAGLVTNCYRTKASTPVWYLRDPTFGGRHPVRFHTPCTQNRTAFTHIHSGYPCHCTGRIEWSWECAFLVCVIPFCC